MQNQSVQDMEAGTSYQAAKDKLQATKDMQEQNWENLSMAGIETSKGYEG